MHNAGLLASRYPDHGKGEAEVREPRIVTGHKVYQVKNTFNILEFLSLFAIILRYRVGCFCLTRNVPGGGGRPGDAAVRGEAPGQHGPHVETGGQEKETMPLMT